MTQSNSIVPVLIPVALDAPYSYLVADGMTLAAGDIVRVPFGAREVNAVVWRAKPVGDVDRGKLRAVIERLDAPPIPPGMLDFAEWVAAYTLAPLGSVLRMILHREPDACPAPRVGYRLTDERPGRMTAARKRVLEAAGGGMAWARTGLAAAAGVSPGVVKGLAEAGALETVELPSDGRLRTPDPDYPGRVTLSSDQKEAAGTLREAVRGDGFSVTLLDGVTSAGKTEVYFEAVAETLRQGRQALILLPEIALTGQFLARFEARFGTRPAEWHSDVSPRQRALTWSAVARGEARAVIGARSALFLPFTELGLIVVDEEHDSAFKQEDRVYYHARDMSVVRAKLADFPVVLASATPSVESRVNADQGRYSRIRLLRRHAGASLPEITAIDLREDPPERGKWLSPVLEAEIEKTLQGGQQALLFLNRRGYAPLTLCRACGHRLNCPHCSAWLVEHRYQRRLMCHHCGYQAPVPKTCPKCGAEDSLAACGPGVERLAEEVEARFPDARRAILSSDLIHGVGAMREILADIAEHRTDLIIGTQLIAKGHHFPQLATVGVVDGDIGLGMSDPRAAERGFQLLYQVVGRAGRGAKQGHGFIQTWQPDHPVMAALVSGERERFYEREIAARRASHMPPFGRLAALIVSAPTHEAAGGYARLLARAAPRVRDFIVLGPAEAPLAVLRGRHRFRLLLKTPRNASVQSYLRAWIDDVPAPRGGVRLAIDVDPQSFS